MIEEAYRSARAIQPGWEIRTEDQRWLEVLAWYEWKSRDPGKPDVVQLILGDDTECLVPADDQVMSRMAALSTEVGS